VLIRSDIQRVVVDFLRTESARSQKDALAVFENQNEEEFFNSLPQEIKERAFEKAALFFGYEKRSFSSVSLMTDYAYASYIKNRRLYFLTSGSTGTPKQCIHTEQMLLEESFGLSPLFVPIKRVISLVPSNHLYGFTFTVVLPHILKVPVVVLPALPTQDWNSVLKEGDLVAGFPLFWNYWLQAGNTFQNGISALSSTAPCKDEIITGLFDAGLSHFTEIYGSSETGVMGFRHEAGEPFTLMPFWEKSVMDGVLKIKRKSQAEWISLPDEIEITPDGKIRPLRRKDFCVQVAGINVFPKHVEQVLAQHPAVKECRVRLMRPEEGERLKAFIVLNEGYIPDHLGIIRTYLSRKLTIHEMPRAFTFGDSLPTAELGKDADW